MKVLNSIHIIDFVINGMFNCNKSTLNLRTTCLARVPFLCETAAVLYESVTSSYKHNIHTEYY